MNRVQHVSGLTSAQRKQYVETEGEQLVEELLANIGHPNPAVRDELNYRVFIELVQENVLPPTLLNKMATTLASTAFLYKGIGDGEGDDVFTRSFSALTLTALFHADKQLAFLSTEEAQTLMEQCLPYLAKERDVRGFVEQKGWAHSIAHGADLGAAILTHPHAKIQYGAQLLQGVKASMWKGRVYQDDEDERLVKIVEALIANEFPEDVLVEWMEQLFDRLEGELYQTGYTPAFFHARTNTLHFAKTLYFTLKFSQQYDKLRGVTSIFIAKWMKVQ